MKTENKSRGKCLDNGEWVYGEAHLQCLKPHIHADPMTKIYIDPATAGQFTGLHDIEGKPTYDGDIYENLDSGLIGVLSIELGVGGYYLHCAEYHDCQLCNSFPFADLDTTNFKVIGNIYDCPQFPKSEAWPQGLTLDVALAKCGNNEKTAKPESILQEAVRIRSGERNADYGDAVENFRRITEISNAITGLSLTAQQICMIMIAVKLARERHNHKRDNLVDLCGYADILNLIEEK